MKNTDSAHLIGTDRLTRLGSNQASKFNFFDLNNERQIRVFAIISYNWELEYPYKFAKVGDLMEFLSWRIEQERIKLHDMVLMFGMSDVRVLEQSQLLDSCLNQYDSFKSESSCQIIDAEL